MKELQRIHNLKLSIAGLCCVFLLLAFDAKPYVALSLVCVALIVIPGARLVKNWAQRRLSRGWPMIGAQFEGGRVVKRAGRRDVYEAEITYSYDVAGNFHGGSYQERFSQEDDAERLIANLKELPFKVRVDPRDPRRSVLVPYRDF